MQKQKETDRSQAFGSEKMLPLIMKMALPSIAAQFVNMLYGIVDRIYIGHIPETGTIALAGVGICNTMIILISAFAQFTGGGGAPLASIALGKGDDREAKKLMNNGVSLLVFFTIVLMLVTYAFMDPILRLTGASDATLPYAHSYLSIYLTGTFFVMIAIGLNPFLNVQGRPGLAMGAVIVGAVMNIVLDPLFIFVFDMGVAGAAVATVISQAASAFFILRFLVSDQAQLKLSLQDMKPQKRILQKMMSLGISPFVMASTESIIGFVMNAGLSVYGDIYVSALTVMQSCMQMYAIPLNGFQQGASPVISFNYGNGNRERVKEGFRIIFVIMTVFNLVCTLAMIFFPYVFARIFTQNEELIALVSRIMPVFLLGMSIFGMQRACQTMFVALNQPGYSLFIALLRKIILLIPLALILPHFFGYMGIYTSEAIADGAAAIICILLFLHQFPRILAKMQASSETE